MATNIDPATHDEQAHKARSIHVKFMQQLFLGIGGATLFGVVGAVALHGAILGFATIGLAALGVGCLYIGSRYLAENIMLDQEHQAKRIGLATRGVPLAIDSPVMDAPSMLPGLGSSEQAEKTAPEKKWAEKFAPVAAQTASWTEKAQTTPATDAPSAVRA